MLAKYGKRFHSGMNCNSGLGKYVNKRGRERGSNKKEHKETKLQSRKYIIRCILTTHGFGLFLSNLPPLTPPPLQSPARSATGSPEIMLFLFPDTLG